MRAIVVVLLAMAVVFVITHLIGSPVSLLLPPDAPHSQFLAIQHELGLDRPLVVQFADYFGSIFRGDLGQSLWQQRPALPLALSHLPATLILMCVSLGLAGGIGIPVGYLAARTAGGLVDKIASGLSAVTMSLASFWLGLILILVFAVKLRLFPTSGYGADGVWLPAITAGAHPFGRLVQLSRAAMLDELGKPYVRVARAKGLSRGRVVITHAMKNTLVPILGLLGFEFATAIGGGLVLAETIFQWPGISYLGYQALQQRDYPLIESCVLIMALVVVITNLLVNIAHGLLDPRLRSA